MLIRSLWARPIVDGSAGKHGELFWSTGVLEKLKPEFQLENILILTPLLPQTDPSRKDQLWRSSNPGPPVLDSLFLIYHCFLRGRTDAYSG